MSDTSTVIITGAAGEIGQAVAARFARNGRRLALFDRTLDGLESLVSALRAAGAPEVGLYAADQGHREEVDAAVDCARAELGPIGSLVANAGFARMGAFLDMPEKIWDRHVDVNLNGTFHTCQSVARKMAEDRQGGSIVVVASCLALFHTDQTGAYNATKSALLMLTRTMAAELGIHRIRANSVLPGVIETAMTRITLDDPGRREALLSETPIGRLGRPEDVASAISFLDSAEAGFITGASLLVDGGQSIYGQPQWCRQDRSTPHESRWIS
jgi:NAD(P)-dependent dehydrogenase (short-subunit alcohol dehydrogenase family)